MIGRVLRSLGLTRPAFMIGVVLGLAGGAGGMLIGFPFLFPPQPVDEAAPLAATELPAETRITSPFRFDESARARDFLHWANGTGAIIRTPEGMVLRLNADFVTSAGPDYYIYLTTRSITNKADFAADTGKLELRKLKAFSGAQNYTLPKEVNGKPIDLAAFHSVTIWCKFFNAYIGTALIEK
jgi:Electron transfer DM13